MARKVSLQITCPKCKKIRVISTVAPDRYDNYEFQLCTSCKLGEYKPQVQIECAVCKTKFTTFLVNTNTPYTRYCSNKCRDVQKTMQAHKISNWLNISKKTQEIIEQEIMTNGEEVFLQLLEIGKKVLFRDINKKIGGCHDVY